MTDISATHTGEIYRDTRGAWRWRVRAANGNAVADSTVRKVVRDGDPANAILALQGRDVFTDAQTAGWS